MSIFAFAPREVSGVPEESIPIHSNIRCELATQLVAKAKPELDIVDAALNAEVRCVFSWRPNSFLDDSQDGQIGIFIG